MTKLSYFFCICLLHCAHLGAKGIAYVVEFEGLKDSDALQAIQSSSQLTILKKCPASLRALRYRADGSIPEIRRLLHGYGYYEAKVDIHIEETFPKTRVLVYISPGPLYRLGSFCLRIASHDGEETMLYETLSLSALGIIPDMPARSAPMQAAEETLLRLLSQCGYPLAKLEGTERIADGRTHKIHVTVHAETGPLCYFGPLAIHGADKVQPRWIEHQLTWQEGQRYDSRRIAQTQRTLIETGLFSTVLLEHATHPTPTTRLLPIDIELRETLHKSLNAGISYQTKFGFGITFGWENRNIGGEGKILRLRGDCTQIYQTGVLAYRIPEFRRPGQDLHTQFQVAHEHIEPTYSQRNYSLTSRMERKVHATLRLAVGGRLERMYVTESLQNGIFLLAQMPLFVGWASVNNILHPTRGSTIEYTLSPSISIQKIGRYYLEQKYVQGCYIPLSRHTDFLVIAQKITLGSILSKQLRDIPIPERFLGGSEENLRGYSYLTVSPLQRSASGKEKPLGGRSAVYYTLEARFRFSESIGIVPFLDIGNVWGAKLPPFDGKWRKSVGLGLRYFTFIGPLRCDMGFPLNRRPGLDHHWRILVNIGQSF